MAEANPMIEIGVSANIDKLKDALQKAEQKVETTTQKMAKQAEAAAAKLEAKLAAQAAAITKTATKRILSLEDQLDDAKEQIAKQAAQYGQKIASAASRSKIEIAALKEEIDKFRIVNEAFRTDAAKPIPSVVQSGQKPAEDAGSSAAQGYLRQFNGVLRAAGPAAIARGLTEGFSQAALEISRGEGADVVANSFVDSLSKSLKSVPIAGTLGQAIEDLVYGDRARQEILDKQQADTARIADEAIATRERQQQRLQRLAELRARTMTMQEDRATGTDEIARMRLEATRQQRQNDEQIRIKQEQIKRQEDLMFSGQPVAKAAILDEIALLKKEQQAYRELNEEIQAGLNSRIQEIAHADKAAQMVEEKKKKEHEAAEAAKAAEQAARSKREADIKAVQQTGKAREDAIAAQIAALQGQSPAARAASIGALTQQFAGNMGGNIQTALGTFRGGGAAVADRAFQEAKAQTEKQEKIVKLQEDMKRLHEETNRKIDAMKGPA